MTPKPLPKSLQTIIEHATTEAADEIAILTPVATWAEGFAVQNETDLETAGQEARKLKAQLGRVDTRRRELLAPIDATRSGVQEAFRPFTVLGQKIETLIKGQMVAYREKVRREEEDRRRQEEAARRAAQETIEHRAEVMEDAGKPEEADALRQYGAALPEPTPIRAPLRAAGTSVRLLWRAVVTDKSALLRAAADNPAWSGLVQPDQAALNAYVRATKGEVPVPGVTFVAEESVAVSGR